MHGDAALFIRYSTAFMGRATGNSSVAFGGTAKGSRSFSFRGVTDEEGGIAMHGYTGGRYGVSIGGGSVGLGASSSREDYAVAIGWNSDARGQASVALGPADAYGYNSFATGWVTEARGNYSSTFGFYTNSYPYASMAIGRYNLVTGDSAVWVGSDPVFIVGDGTSNNNRSNSFLIQKNGQTAIGYNAPTGMLQVSSALGSLNNGGTLDPTHATLLLGSTTSGLAFDPNQIESIGTGLHLNFNSTRDVYLVNGGGDVAIGHQAPLAKLDVEHDNWQMRLDNDAAGGDDWYIGSSANSWNAGGGKLLFSFNNGSANSVITLEPSREVGIGTNTPASRLHVSADAGEDGLRVQIFGLTRLLVKDNGGVSIGANVVPPAQGLYVQGITEFNGDAMPDDDNQYDLGGPLNRWDNVWATNGIIQTSDLRDKTDITSLKYGLSTVMRMRPVSYKWRDKPEEGKKVGVIAQELKQVVPELVHQNPDDPAGRMGVNYAEAVPILIKAIQEQQTQIKQQQILIEKLQEDVESLKAGKDE
ncbi:MAG: tail fiber domain-containing protein, partial [Bacteroidota bacterium]